MGIFSFFGFCVNHAVPHYICAKEDVYRHGDGFVS